MSWVLVGDLDASDHTQAQIDACDTMGFPLHAKILCNEEKHKDSKACTMIPDFPALCHTEANMCVSGLRTTKEHFAELQEIVKNPKTN